MPKRGKQNAPEFKIEKLSWADIVLGAIETPARPLKLTLGLGSGLALRAGDPPGVLWAIGDRGPNLKIELAIDTYGLEHLTPLRDIDGAKIMPRPDIGPMICELKLEGASVHLVRQLPLCDDYGRPLSGLPIPDDGVAKMEPAYGLDSALLGADPSGADTESIVALKDGTFWVGDEYGPSLLNVAANGRVLRRWVPKGLEHAFKDARYPVEAILPKIAARRRLNRGFEALAVSADEKWLYVVFQSALAHPDEAARKHGHTARIWKLDAHTGDVAAQFLYPFDAPETFARDGTGAKWADLKLCEAVAIAPDRLLLLERISQTAKFYIVDLAPDAATPRSHLKSRTRPTLEQMDAAALAAAGVRVLSKRLIFSTDGAPDIDPDLEGMAVVSSHELILVNDNDFGVEGATTSFWRIRFEAPVFAGKVKKPRVQSRAARPER